MSPVRLRGEGVEKRYGRVAALRGIDFEIAPGESVAILGANGAGKSSLLKILAGLSRPSGGRFDASGSEDPDGSALRRDLLRARVGYVGHATLLYGELTARENLVFAARLHGQRPTRDALDAVLEEFALADVAERRADTFSRGMAQRLAIARAVVHAPSLLLLDEPFTGLDEASGERLQSRLEAQRDDAGGARSLVLVTHDPRRAVALADRAILLHRGSVRATPARGDAAFDAEALREALVAVARGAEAAA
ncbi:MAG: ABC transporter ATP-binding protein [Myxococcota bacterium]